MMALVSRGILMPRNQVMRVGCRGSAWPLTSASLTCSDLPEPIKTLRWNSLNPVQNPVVDQFLSLSLLKNLGLDQLKSDLDNDESESESAELELEQIRPQIVSRLQKLTPHELARCVRILALWPCTRKSTHHPHVLNKEDTAILDLRNDLQQECVSRLRCSSNDLESDRRYLREVGDRFHLATSWSLLRTKGKKDEFLYQFVRKHADKSGRSSSFFKRVSKDQLVEFLRLSDVIVPLPDTYHKYYAFYKVIDLFDHMNVDDVVLCLHVLKKHAMLPSATHPMALELVSLVLEKTRQFVEDLKDDQLLKILIFLQRYAQVLKNVDNQFQTVLNSLESRGWSGQRLEMVLRLLFLCSQTPHHRPKIWQEAFLKVTSGASDLELSDLQNFGLISTVICSENNKFSDEEQMAIFVRFGNAVHEAKVTTTSDCNVLVTSTFALLLKGFFHPKLVRSIFTNSTLTAIKSNGSVAISKRYKFSSNCPVISKTARILVALSNVLRFDHPIYSGPLLQETDAFVPNIPSQQTTSFHGASWLDCAQKLAKDLSALLGGPDYLCENYVVPYAEVPTLVFVLDSVTRKPVRIPQEYKDKHFHVNKSVLHDMADCEWFAVLLHPSKLNSLLVKFQNEFNPVVDQHMKRLGYTKLDFKSPKWFLDVDPERNQEIVTEFIQSQISPLLMVSQIEIVL